MRRILLQSQFIWEIKILFKKYHVLYALQIIIPDCQLLVLMLSQPFHTALKMINVVFPLEKLQPTERSSKTRFASHQRTFLYQKCRFKSRTDCCGTNIMEIKALSSLIATAFPLIRKPQEGSAFEAGCQAILIVRTVDFFWNWNPVSILKRSYIWEADRSISLDQNRSLS